MSVRILVGPIAVVCGAAGSVAALAAQPVAAPPAARDSASEIVVERQLLSTSGLADTTIVMERGRDNRIEIRLRPDGVFRSYFNGVESDWGAWSIEDGAVRFDGRLRGSFRARHAIGRKVGDSWEAPGLDGKIYQARLVAGS